jgi:co-chaperonin GroES (HSP10)
MTFVPLGDRVAIRRDAAEDETTSAGLFIPGKYKDRPQMGTVVAIGPDVTTLSIGARVLMQNFVGIGVNVNGEELIICRIEEVVGFFQ